MENAQVVDLRLRSTNKAIGVATLGFLAGAGLSIFFAGFGLILMLGGIFTVLVDIAQSLARRT